MGPAMTRFHASTEIPLKKSPFDLRVAGRTMIGLKQLEFYRSPCVRISIWKKLLTLRAAHAAGAEVLTPEVKRSQQ